MANGGGVEWSDTRLGAAARVFAGPSICLETWAGRRFRLRAPEIDGDRVTARAGRGRLTPGTRLLARSCDPANVRSVVPITVTWVQAVSADSDRVGLFVGEPEPDGGMRATGRTGLRAGALLAASDGSPDLTATVIDLSPGGIGLVLDDGWARAGGCRVLRIDWPWPLRATVEVRWAAVPDGRARLGGRFVDLPASERSRMEHRLAAAEF